MRGRPATFDPDAILKNAQQLFWAKGYAATSLEEVLKAMGMGSGSFYNTFKGGKKELFRKAINQRRAALKEFERLVEGSEQPIETIKTFFLSIADAEHHTHMLGCIIANTVTEMTLVDEELQNETVAVLMEVEQFYTRVFSKAQQDGTLKNQTAAEILGRYLITIWNGLNVTRRMHPDKKMLRQLIEIQLQIIS